MPSSNKLIIIKKKPPFNRFFIKNPGRLKFFPRQEHDYRNFIKTKHNQKWVMSTKKQYLLFSDLSII